MLAFRLFVCLLVLVGGLADTHACGVAVQQVAVVAPSNSACDAPVAVQAVQSYGVPTLAVAVQPTYAVQAVAVQHFAQPVSVLAVNHVHRGLFGRIHDNRVAVRNVRAVRVHAGGVAVRAGHHR